LACMRPVETVTETGYSYWYVESKVVTDQNQNVRFEPTSIKKGSESSDELRRSSAPWREQGAYFC
jgi:hypothetical protein